MFLLQVVPLKVYELSMWMAHFNHPTPKRTILVSNSEQIAVLHRGRLSRSQKPASFPTAVKYVDGAGRVRYKGTTQLKSTQCHDKSLVHLFVCLQYQLLSEMKKHIYILAPPSNYLGLIRQLLLQLC